MCDEQAVDQLKHWLLKHYEHNTLADIANHGAQCGWAGIIYYEETNALYETYKEAIWYLLEDDALNFGCQSTIELIAGFNGAKDVSTDEQFRNLLAWYAVERLAYQITEGEYLA